MVIYIYVLCVLEDTSNPVIISGININIIAILKKNIFVCFFFFYILWTYFMCNNVLTGPNMETNYVRIYIYNICTIIIM